MPTGCRGSGSVNRRLPEAALAPVPPEATITAAGVRRRRVRGRQLMIQFQCQCGKVLQAKEEYIGLEITCPYCHKVMPIPDVTRAAQPPVAAPPVSSSPQTAPPERPRPQR